MPMSCLGAMPWLYTRLCLRLPKVGKISDYIMAAAGLQDQTARNGRLCMNESIASMLVTQESAADRSIWCPPYLNCWDWGSGGSPLVGLQLEDWIDHDDTSSNKSLAGIQCSAPCRA